MRALPAAICVALVLGASSANAVTAEVAKTCNAALAKKFPPRVPGNPAAGSAQGNGAAQREFYKKCLESDGKIEDDSPPSSGPGNQRISPSNRPK